MKATTTLAFAALVLTGAACSQAVPEQAEVAKIVSADVSETVAQAPADDGFNLRIPGDELEAGGSDGFNLRMPGDAAETGGFQMPDTIVSDGALANIPEIGAPVTETPETPDMQHGDGPLIRIE